MALSHIPLTQIDERELQRLIDGEVAEARNIEYKRETYGREDAAHAEWLADISSFANAAGGDILIGMEAMAGIPRALVPLEIDLDAEILRLDGIARSNLQPRITNLNFHQIPLKAGGRVLVVRVPRSFNPPHRIVRNGKGQNRFWARSSAGKYEPNVDELRALFTLAPQLTERIRDFRIERVAKIAARAVPVVLMGQACLSMHVVPFLSFDPGVLLPLAQAARYPDQFAPMGSRNAANCSVNFDGLLIKSNALETAPQQRAYVQVYRTGRIEAVASVISARDCAVGKTPRLAGTEIEGNVLMALVRFLKGLNALGIEPPYAIMISLVGVKGIGIDIGVQASWGKRDEIEILTEDQLHFAEVILESVPNTVQECGVMLRPFIEQVANAAGLPTSPSFDSQGNYLHHFRA